MVISLNNQKKLFVFRSGGQLETATFADVQRDTRFMASKLQRPDLLPNADDFGHLTGFEKFEHARKAWATSAYSVDTWFTPGTPDAVQHLLERFRLSGAPVRLFIGDPETGRDWLKQHVFGRLDRTGGQLRIPLLLPTDGQPAETIDSRLVLRIMNSDGTELYRHPRYKLPSLSMAAEVDPKKRAQGQHVAVIRDDERLVARFPSVFRASEYMQFLSGILPHLRADPPNTYQAA